MLVLSELAKSNDMELPDDLADYMFESGFRSPTKIVNLVVPLMIYMKTQELINVSRKEMIPILKDIRSNPDYIKLKNNMRELIENSVTENMAGTGLFKETSKGVLRVAKCACNM